MKESSKIPIAFSKLNIFVVKLVSFQIFINQFLLHCSICQYNCSCLLFYIWKWDWHEIVHCTYVWKQFSNNTSSQAGTSTQFKNWQVIHKCVFIQVGSKCGKKLQAANIAQALETLRPLSYSSVGKLSKFWNIIFWTEHALYFRLRHRRGREVG